jgi:hypothetical protein
MRLNTFAVLQDEYPELDLTPQNSRPKTTDAFAAEMNALIPLFNEDNTGGQSRHRRPLADYLTHFGVPIDIYSRPSPPSVETIDLRDVYPFVREGAKKKWHVLRIKNAIDDFDGLKRLVLEFERGKQTAVDPEDAPQLADLVERWTESALSVDQGRLASGDGPPYRGVEFHVPIDTDSRCLVRFFDDARSRVLFETHLPADGTVFLVNAHTEHERVGPSGARRLHLAFPIAVESANDRV